ncbi:MAG: sigma-54-dependent Fis family transcriptional regulator [Verrucomicrobia bacterium]|nr:sigma-54-dependent Fis family transcriptional regulator [Verrucomicrobiota bacterium]
MQVLVVDDEKNIRRAMALALESMDHQVVTASSAREALDALRQTTFSVIFLDLKLGQEDGLRVLADMRRLAPSAAVVIITAYASIETAVEAIRQGAFDYLPKPCTPEQIRQLVDRIIRTQRLEHRVLELETQLRSEAPEVDLVSESPAMRKALEVARKAAGSEATVLLLGESGTGKSVLARAMHQLSPRREGAFVTVSCPSLSRDLLESELFGHVRGSFTGAHQDAPGKVAAAQGGTLFLDEIGDLPAEIQAKLLRLLQEREYERVGDPHSRKADVRVIAATNRNLGEAVAAGRFREDLFYRLNVISITLPPLRERATDIPRLAARHLAFFARQTGKRVDGFSDQARAVMQGYTWPGNLRELRNVIERAVILGSGPLIGVEDLAIWPVHKESSEVRVGAQVSLETIENAHIRQVLAQSRTVDEAAEVLGIDPATLYRRKKKLS